MCLRLKGQENPRLRTKKTFLRSIKSERDTRFPLKSMEVNSGARVLGLTLAIEISSLFYFLIQKSRIKADFDEGLKKKHKSRSC